MKLRRLTSAGVDDFSAWVGRLNETPTLGPPLRLLADNATSELIQPDIDIEQQAFTNRFDAARYLAEKLTVPGVVNLERDVGLWAWLTLFYFDQLCPQRADGTRKVRALSNYIPEVGMSRRYYRHLLMGPTLMYSAHIRDPECLRALLYGPLHVGTAETYRLFVENSSLVASTAAVGVATTLYFDSRNNKLKRGAGSKERGGCRRLIAFLQQVDCTFDLGAVSRLTLLGMLPREFSKYLPLSELPLMVSKEGTAA